MKKGNRILALLLVFVMTVGFLPTFEITSNAADDSILKFKYGSEEYSVYAGQDGSGDGVQWTCDAKGNIALTFTKVGTTLFTVTKGNLSITSAELTGGGAGGSAAVGGGGSNGGSSGAGGGGGEIKTVTGISGFKTGDVGEISITVGAGGKGAEASYSAACSADYGTAHIQCAERGGYSYVSGEAGGKTSITAGSFSYAAEGGAADGGGASVHGCSNGNNGIPATATRAAGGASGGGMNYWDDSSGMAGVFNDYSYTCFLCGENCERNYHYNVLARWYDPTNGRFYSGGSGVDGSGKGGDPGNDHNCGGRSVASNDGGNASSYGAGGGGSSYCSGYFALYHHAHSGSGSTATHYFVGGGGGDGYQGIAKLGGKIDLVTVKIVKTSDDGILSGHRFTVTDAAGNTYNVETDAAGIAIVDGLDEGKYTVAEVQSGSYMPVSAPKIVTAASSGTYTVSFDNTAKKLSVDLTKKDADNGGSKQGNASIVGAEYTLYSYTGSKTAPQNITAVKMKPILATGKASWNDLTLAKTYFIQETKAAPGYQLDTEKHFIDFDPAGTSEEYNEISIHVTDKVQRGKLVITKVDSVTTTPQGDGTLQNAVFEIYNRSAASVTVKGKSYAVDEKIEEVTTNADGIATSSELPYGCYEVVEKTSPVGYIVRLHSSSVENYTGETVKITSNITVNEDIQRATLTVSKNDIHAGAAPEGNATLAGAQFQITNASAAPISLSAEQRSESVYITWAAPSSTASNGDYIYNVGSRICTLTSKDDTGACETVELPYGTYTVHESAAPVGYLADAKDQTVTLHENDVIKAVSVTLTNSPKTSTVTVNKKDAETGSSPQGDGMLAGMTFEIYNVSQYPVYYKDAMIPVNGLVDTLTTDERGDAVSDPLPFGRYRVVETEAPLGYEIPMDSYYEEGENYNSSKEMQNVTITLTDEIKRGDLRILKYDTDTYNVMQGDATFAGTVFEVYNVSDAAVYISDTVRSNDPSTVYADGTAFANGSIYPAGELIATVTTGGAGDVTLPNLPYGRYRVVETVPPVGYLLNDGDVYDVVITNYDKKHEIIAYAEAICKDTVKRGHWTIFKTDDYTGAVPEGAATLEGARFAVINKSAGPVWFVGGVKGNAGTEAASLYQPDELVQYIYTDAEGKAVTGELPYGRYLLQEENAPEGYLIGIGDGNEGSGAMTDTLKNYDTADIIGNQDVELKDSVKRGDFAFTKKGQAAETLVNVVFRVTSMTTGESHIIVTDANGEFNSSSDKFLHSDGTNCNDACVSEDGVVDEAKLDPDSGIWFTGLADETLEPNDKRGALPYDTYLVEELRCKGNADLALLSFKVTVAVGGYTIDYGSMTDLNPMVIYSELVDADTLMHSSRAAKDTALIETLDLHSTVRGRSYTVTCTLINAKTGETAVDAQGKQLTETKTVLANATEVSNIRIRFDFDASDMAGVTLIATDVLTYEDNGKTVTAAVHDLTTMLGDDVEAQSVRFPAIGTTLKDDKGEKEVAAQSDVTLVDEVAYKGLDVSRTYKLTGTLVCKSSGEPVKTASGQLAEASVVFRPDSPDGFALVTFEHVDLSSLAGECVVAFETLAYTSPYIILCEHEDLNDEAQTVTIPKIRTTAVNENWAKNIAAAANQTIIDTVSYENLLPDTEYRIETDLIDTETGKSVLDEIKASVFTSDSTGNGAVRVTLDGVNAEKLAGKTVVVYETLLRKNNHGEAVIRAEHRDITDAAQFIYVLNLGTRAVSVRTAKRAEPRLICADDYIELVDFVDYENLALEDSEGNKTVYTLVGRLYDKDTDSFIVADGRTVTATARLLKSGLFTRPDSSGTVEVSFPALNIEALEGHTLVVFESLYLGEYEDAEKIPEEALVYEHKNKNDEAQTLYIPKLRTVLRSDKGLKIVLASADSSLTDTVTYSNLIPGREYTMEAKLYNKTENKLTKFSASKTFIPETADGTVDVVFDKLDLSGFADSSLVCFEYLYIGTDTGNDDDIRAKHEDKDDEDQTVFIPRIRTTASGEHGEKVIVPSDILAPVKIIDTVDYSNLAVDESLRYTMTGTLMYADTNEPVTDADGKALISRVDFVPEAPDGTVEVTFAVNIASVAGRKLVVYETLYCKETDSGTPTPITQHRDLQDEGQTVEIRNLGRITKIDGTTKERLPNVTVKVQDVTDRIPVDVGEFITDERGEIRFPIAPGHSYEFWESRTLDGYELDSTHYTMKANKDGRQTGDGLLVNWKIGTVVIRKVDSITGEPVEGAVIDVCRQTGSRDAQGRPTGERVFTQETDVYGRIYFYPDAPGDYFYYETAAPAGYYLDNETYSFTVKSDMTATGTVKFNNSRFGTIVIKKLDESGRILSGAVISIYNSVTGARLGTARTDEFGRVYFVSPGAGSYFFLEEEAPKGYIRDKEKHSFTVSAEGSVSGTTVLVNRRDPNPQTGDTLHRGTWAMAAAIGAALMVGSVTLLLRRRRKARN